MTKFRLWLSKRISVLGWWAMPEPKQTMDLNALSVSMKNLQAMSDDLSQKITAFDTVMAPNVKIAAERVCQNTLYATMAYNDLISKLEGRT